MLDNFSKGNMKWKCFSVQCFEVFEAFEAFEAFSANPFLKCADFLRDHCDRCSAV